jgi:hypothetical protein
MIDDNNGIRPSAKGALDELIMIEKYIENPEQNIPIKLELDKRSNLGTNKMEECLTQDLPRRIEEQDKVESNQNNQINQYKEDMERPIKNDYYLDYFKGNMYEVIGTAKHSETLEEMVVYRALYGDGELWVRPAEMWNETVIRDGKTFKRFEYVEK